MRVFERIVSLTDYARFARRFAGVGEAFARRVRTGAREVMAVAVTTADGSPVPPEAPLLGHLDRAIRENSARPFPLVLGTFQPIPFFLRLQIRVARDFALELVRQSVLSALGEAYGPGKLPIAHALAQSEVLTLVQALPGIMSVQAEAFHRLDSPPGCLSKLPARAFVWDAPQGVLHAPERLQLGSAPAPEVLAALAL